MIQKIKILGGMWGFFNNRSRSLAKDIYNKMIDQSIAKEFNHNNQKGLDQSFLSGKLISNSQCSLIANLILIAIKVHVYPTVKDKALVHDSFLCSMFHDSVPFPSKRQGALFVSFGSQMSELYEYTYNKTFHAECPVECRPKDHMDWKWCQS